jgi:hypothetical protein
LSAQINSLLTYLLTYLQVLLVSEVLLQIWLVVIAVQFGDELMAGRWVLNTLSQPRVCCIVCNVGQRSFKQSFPKLMLWKKT